MVKKKFKDIPGMCFLFRHKLVQSHLACNIKNKRVKQHKQNKLTKLPSQFLIHRICRFNNMKLKYFDRNCQ